MLSQLTPQAPEQVVAPPSYSIQKKKKNSKIEKLFIVCAKSGRASEQVDSPSCWRGYQRPPGNSVGTCCMDSPSLVGEESSWAQSNEEFRQPWVMLSLF